MSDGPEKWVPEAIAEQEEYLKQVRAAKIGEWVRVIYHSTYRWSVEVTVDGTLLEDGTNGDHVVLQHHSADGPNRTTYQRKIHKSRVIRIEKLEN